MSIGRHGSSRGFCNPFHIRHLNGIIGITLQFHLNSFTTAGYCKFLSCKYNGRNCTLLINSYLFFKVTATDGYFTFAWSLFFILSNVKNNILCSQSTGSTDANPRFSTFFHSIVIIHICFNLYSSFTTCGFYFYLVRSNQKSILLLLGYCYTATGITTLYRNSGVTFIISIIVITSYGDSSGSLVSTGRRNVAPALVRRCCPATTYHERYCGRGSCLWNCRTRCCNIYRRLWICISTRVTSTIVVTTATCCKYQHDSC